MLRPICFVQVDYFRSLEAHRSQSQNLKAALPDVVEDSSDVRHSVRLHHTQRPSTQAQ